MEGGGARERGYANWHFIITGHGLATGWGEGEAGRIPRVWVRSARLILCLLDNLSIALGVNLQHLSSLA